MHKHSVRRILALILLVVFCTAMAALAEEHTPILSFEPALLVDEQGEFCLANLPWEISPEEAAVALGMDLGEGMPWKEGDNISYTPDLGVKFPGLDAQSGPGTRQILTFREGKFSQVQGSMAIREDGEASFDAILKLYEAAFGPYDKKEEEIIQGDGSDGLRETCNVYWYTQPREHGQVTLLQLRLAIWNQSSYNIAIRLYLLDGDTSPDAVAEMAELQDGLADD